ncbi:MAG: MFS transporter [Phycisphaeraceae bacterium]|nr:MAG: MFS transporter [Phycisphaeraceae bacterium]
MRDSSLDSSRESDPLRRIVNIRVGEGVVVLLAAAVFYCLLMSFFIMRPIREEMAQQGDVRNLKWLFVGTLGGMLIANPIFSWVAARTTRRFFIPAVYRFFMFNIVVFLALFAYFGVGAEASGEFNPHIARAFYVWASVFNLFIVAVMWGLFADIFTSAQGKRLFGLIGVGGTLGAASGAATTVFVAGHLPNPLLLLILSLLLLEVAVQCLRGLMRRYRIGEPDECTPGRAERDSAGEPAEPGGSAWDGLIMILRSPYLLAVCAFMLLLTITSTFVYFMLHNVISESGMESSDRIALFARMDLAINGLTLLIQLFLTGRIMRMIGVGATLGALPLVTMIGFGAVAIAPVVAVVVVFNTLRRVSNFALSRPAREVLYTVVPRSQKYKSKSLIDTFFYRGGDVAGAFLFDALFKVLAGIGAVALAAVPIAAVWGGTAIWLGRRQREKEAAAPAVIDTPSAILPP